MLSLQGYNRFSKDEFIRVKKGDVLSETYEELEKLHISFVKTDITRLFTLNVEDYFYV